MVSLRICIQTQINALQNINSVSLSANNVFTGLNQFSSLILNGNLTINNGANVITQTQLLDIPSIDALKWKTTEISHVGIYTNIANTLTTPIIDFSDNINNVSSTVFNYLKNLTSDIQGQFNSLSGNTSSPPGTIISNISSNLSATTNNQYLLCNGAEISSTTNATLFTLLGTNYGVGNGTTTFNLPNYQGMFLRGQGSQTQNSVVYSSATNPYTFQPDQTENHTHSGPGGTYLINSYQQPENSLAQGYSKSATNLNRPATLTFESTGNMNTGKGGSSTYPANYSVYYYTKT